MTRRTFLSRTAAIGGAAMTSSMARIPSAESAVEPPPNILVVIVDQLRTPQWFPPDAAVDRVLPSLTRLRSGAVSFERHYTASNACTPSRSCLLTGLYTHQTYVFDTANNAAGTTSALDPGFPTWGTLLRERGYATQWFGKWHLSESCDLEPFGFGGGTCPSPNGAPSQGLRQDPKIADQFVEWVAANGAGGPWCTTVSLVNPHDIAWYPRFTRAQRAPSVFRRLPPNFETAREIATRKPRLQRKFQQVESEAFGIVRWSGSGFERGWTRLLDLYLEFQRDVDVQIGRILNALEANPQVAANTVIVFTSDHGEYGGSHGLRGKGGAAYEEAIRVPLYVKDPRGKVAARTDPTRTQLTSSVDVAPLLLTIAEGGSAWRSDPRYAHLAGRADIAAIAANPRASGRAFVLHATDEVGFEEAPATPFTRNVPYHVIGYRTPAAKLTTYSYWEDNSIEIASEARELECYDYRRRGGRLELENLGKTGAPIVGRLDRQLTDVAIPQELRAPLPQSLQPAQERARAAFVASTSHDQPPPRRPRP